MALVNGIYVHVVEENVDREAKYSEHSVETGIDITDTMRRKPIELSISGKIVDYSINRKDSADSVPSINAWICLVKKDYTEFETMSFDRLNGELIAFDDGVRWVNTGEIQYLNDHWEPVDVSNGANNVVNMVKFEVTMPPGSTVRVQNAYKKYCCFSIINKSTTGYTVQDYNADADEISDIILSNTYNGQTGRIRTEFTNYDSLTTYDSTDNKKAAWVLEQLTVWWETGALIEYQGRNYFGSYQIRTFSSSHPNTNTGGADFSMVLKEHRSTQNSYTASGDAGEEINDVIAQGSTQQITTGNGDEVWYTTRQGDTIWGLVVGDVNHYAPYKDLQRGPIDGKAYSAVDWVMAMNPKAFSTYGDFRTLQINKKILLGYR